ncbi:MAG: GreA/GreB family elongation factor [Dehalococcoidia bacterium]|nr:GreA/GreB family elongation factor [Dehalococcoidia bacterium]
MKGKGLSGTEKGLLKIVSELDYLCSVRRREITELQEQSRAAGGIVCNAEYETARYEQALVERRIRDLQDIVNRAAVMEPPAACCKAGFGTKVLVQDNDGKGHQFTLVESVDSNPSEGKISIDSPVGKALLGRSEGDRVEVRTPAGLRDFLIVRIGLADEAVIPDPAQAEHVVSQTIPTTLPIHECSESGIETPPNEKRREGKEKARQAAALKKAGVRLTKGQMPKAAKKK